MTAVHSFSLGGILAPLLINPLLDSLLLISICFVFALFHAFVPITQVRKHDDVKERNESVVPPSEVREGFCYDKKAFKTKLNWDEEEEEKF